MISLQTYIDRISSQTGYYTDWAKQKEIGTGNFGDPPRVIVGYDSVHSSGNLGDSDTPDTYLQYEEDLVQVFTVQFNCDTTSLHSVWQNIYNALAGWNYSATEINYSGLMYAVGGIMGVEGGRTAWKDRWKLDFPRIT